MSDTKTKDMNSTIQKMENQSPPPPAANDGFANTTTKDEKQADNNNSMDASELKLPTVSPTTSHDDDYDALACPICFQDEHLAVASPCQHVFCVSCLERILLGSGNASNHSTMMTTRELGEFVSAEYPAGREEDLEQLKIPAWNACPICRQSIFLWDMKHCVKTTTVTDTACAKKAELLTEMECKLSENDCTPANKEVAAKEATPCFTVGDYIYSRQPPDFDKISFLRSSVWLESSDGSTGQVGFGSFHFPPHVDEPDVTTAFYNLQRVSHKRLLFHDCLYHAPSRVLSARLVPEETDSDAMAVVEESSSYRLILAFSADGSFVRSGALVVEQPVLTPSRHTTQFPYDGFYEFQDERVVVVGHKCILNGQPLLLQRVFEVDEDYSESFGEDDDDLFPVSLLKLVTPNHRVVATTACTTGVGVGAQLVWNIKTGIAGQRRTWRWQRLAGPSAVTDRLPRHKIHRWGGPYARRWLKRQGPLPVEEGVMAGIPTFHGDSVWGNVFCQAFKVGLASYHFVPPSDGQEVGQVYISYENPMTSDWPPLDNGQPIPAKVYFHNISFPTPTTFRGHILWQEDYGTPWQGMIRWEYEMIFDEKFTCIVGGSVTSFEAHTPETPRELSRYGESLVYVNAALYREFRRLVTEEEQQQQLVANNNGENSNTDNAVALNQDWSDRFRSRSLELRLRLQRENAGVRTIAMVHRLMTVAYQGEAETCPIDYNIIIHNNERSRPEEQGASQEPNALGSSS